MVFSLTKSASAPPQRDSREYNIIDEVDDWTELPANADMSPQTLAQLPPEEKMEILTAQNEKLRGRAQGDWNRKGIDNYRTVRQAMKIQSGLTEDQVAFCAKVLTDALKSRKDDVLAKKDLSDVVTELKTALDGEYGTHKWHCMIGRKMSFHLTSSSYINFYFKNDDMTVVMFKAFTEGGK